ncbi:MAG: galactosyldiacylglycerol synthase [Negativicutes bacterium]|nr:galactosyldiacylglycerol synthase [Negativicutes bacterium]
MARKHRILIITASVGSGHTQAALAIKQALKKEYGHNASIVDFLSGGGRYIGKVVKSTYFQALKIFPEIWDYVYRYSNEPRYGDKIKSVLQLASERYMQRIIRRYSPDVILFTHPFPCAAAAGLKKDGELAAPLIGVVTDYAVHRLWEYPEIDHYCVATDEAAQELLSQGFSPAVIHNVGIPVREPFWERPDVSPQKGNVLIMGGGMGMGLTAEAIRAVSGIPGVQSVKAVCGSNSRLYQILKASEARVSRLHVYGFTQKVPQLMAEAELLVTKPGGLTASEALALGLPMVLIDAIGGQEEDNAAFLVERGAARIARSMAELEMHVAELLAAPDTLQAMRRQAQSLGKPKAAQAVAEIIMQSLTVKERPLA